MRPIEIFFPREAARLKLLERRVAELRGRTGLDDLQSPELAEVLDELRSGRDIKAAQLYCEATGASVGEGSLAVQEIKARLIR